MRVKAKITCEVALMPNRENRYMVQWQWVDGGILTTLDNKGQGYTLAEAQHVAGRVGQAYGQSRTEADPE